MFKLTTLFILSFILSVFYTYTISAQTSLDKNVDCLAEAIYFEARSENFMAQLAVGNVIYNRVKSSKFPNTFCGVVHQAKKWKGKLIRNRCQFSYYCDGKSEKYKELDALLEVMDTSELILQGVMLEQTIGATHYHTWKVSPHWSRSPTFIKLGRVGSHIFYVDKGKQ
jgi:spore germination cell wall hydrolase CwlJ-like protein